MRISPAPLQKVLLLALFAIVGVIAASTPARAVWLNSPSNPLNLNNMYWFYYSGGEPPMVADGSGGFWTGTMYYSGFATEYSLRHVSSTGQQTAFVSSETVSGQAKSSLVLARDQADGVYAVWKDTRGSGDIYAQHYSGTGLRQWVAGGVPVCANAGVQSNPVAVRGDYIWGLWVAWTDYRNGDADIYTQQIYYIDGSPFLAVNGAPVVAVAGSVQDSVAMVPDGVNGMVFAWQDGRNSGTTGTDLYAQRLNGGGAVQWTWAPTGALVANSAGNAGPPHLSLMNLWFHVIWEEDRGLTTGHDVYDQHVTVFGGQAVLGNGAVVCNAAGDQLHPVATGDGLGGVIVAWDDARNSVSTGTDIYTQRMGSGGVAQWVANGVLLCNAPDAQAQPRICSDEANGAIVAWCDNRTGFSDVYARRVLSTGTASWNSNGNPVFTADWQEGTPVILPDGTNGAFLVMGGNSQLYNGSALYSLYAQRIDRFGVIGSPEPTIAKVKDVPNDQGGYVRVSWNASYMDALPSNKVDEYWVWREAPVFAAAAKGATMRAVPTAAGVIYWERIAVVPATAIAGYSVVAATTSDSIGGSNPRTRFQVEAHQLGTEYFWASAPDSGYSVDNLGPAAPSPQYAAYSAGTTRLGWLPNHEADLMGYELHRGSSASFTPSPATFVTSKPDTGYADAAGAPYFYKLVAVDVHGNRSPVVTLAPTGTLDAPGAALAEAFFAAPSPNPARGGTLLRFGLAREGVAKLAIYDAAGRLVRTVHTGVLSAGEHSLRWNARGEGGRDVAPGLYLARLETPGAAAMVRRIVVTQ